MTQSRWAEELKEEIVELKSKCNSMINSIDDVYSLRLITKLLKNHEEMYKFYELIERLMR